MSQTPVLNNHKFLLKYITSCSIFLVILLVIGLYLYKLGIDDAKSNLFEQSKTILSQSVSDMDASFCVMEALSLQIVDNLDIVRLERAESADSADFYLSAASAMKFLTSFEPSETVLPIHDYYIYLPETDYLLSSAYFSKTDLYYRFTKKYDTRYYEEWLSILNKEVSSFSFYEISHFSQKAEPSYLYLLPIKNNARKKNGNPVICFEIDNNKLRRLFANLPFYEKGFLYVVDNQSNKAFSITEAQTPDLSFATIEEILSEINDPSHFSRIRLENENMLVTSIVSPYNGWTYYMFQPEKMVFSSLLSYQKIYSFIIILVCIVSFLIILILSKKNVAPMLKIRTQLENTLKEHSSLQQTLEEQKQIIAQSYVDRLITGRIHNENELNYISHYLNICTLNRKFCVLYIIAYYVNEPINNPPIDGDVLSSAEQAGYREKLLEEFRETFGKDILIHEAAYNSYALLLSIEEEFSSKDAIALTAGQFLTLQRKIMEYHSFYLFCGMGNQNKDLSYTWKSYQQALQAVAYASNKAPFQPYGKLDKSLDGYYFPLEFAQKLTEFITFGNEKQVQESLHLIEHENQTKRSLTPQMRQLLFSDIRNTLLKIRFSIASEIEESSENDRLFDQIDSALESTNLNYQILSEVALQLTSLCEPKQQEGNQLILTIQEYIRTNYVDSSLCLNKISDEFGISESYFSYLFKAETKTNFSEYLEKLRMDQALVLLQTTSIPISSLYLEVGYNNANSFRRAFKKVHGVSPKAIRDFMKQNEQT